jgi:hypothetical protein
MGSINTAKKVAWAVQTVVGQAKRSKVGGALLSSFRVTAGSFSKIAHVLWLEVTGFIFLCLGLMGAGAGVREYHRYGAGAGSLNKIWAAGIFAVLFAYFGISSFWRARRKRV